MVRTTNGTDNEWYGQRSAGLKVKPRMSLVLMVSSPSSRLHLTSGPAVSRSSQLTPSRTSPSGIARVGEEAAPVGDRRVAAPAAREAVQGEGPGTVAVPQGPRGPAAGAAGRRQRPAPAVLLRRAGKSASRLEVAR